jgi:aldehyde dehydrogenase (NAD+)
LFKGGVGVVVHPLAAHADVDLISFTGATRAGILVAKAAADTVKRVHQELGGKSPNIILPDADLETAVTLGAERCFRNSGQSCNAPTRMFIDKGQYERAAAIAKRVAESKVIGPPGDESTWLGPVAGRAQFEKIQRYIALGIDAGADLVAGGLGRPEHLPCGYYVRPTVFGNVRNDMSIAREEIFGPVLCLIGYDDEDDAIRQANDTVFGLAAHVQSGDIEHARRVASRLRAGHVNINYPPLDFSAPFGGYKQSGNGREYGRFGLEEFLEMKSVLGYSGPEAKAAG